MILLALFLLVGICMASWSDDLLISALIDPEHGNVTESERHDFMTCPKTVEEIDEILDRLPFLYKKHFGQPFLIESPKKVNQPLPHVKEFVDAIPDSHRVKFLLVPPGQLRQEIVDRRSVSALQIFRFLSTFERVYVPYVEALKKDMKPLIEEMSDADCKTVNDLCNISMMVFNHKRSLDGFLCIVMSLMDSLAKKTQIIKSKEDPLLKLADTVASDQKVISTTHSNSSNSTNVSESFETRRGIKRSFQFSDRLYSSSVFRDLPIEIENIILSQTCFEMRLVCRAAALSNFIPAGPSHPIKFLSMMESDTKRWKLLSFVFVDSYYSFMSKHDVEMVKRFLETNSAGSVELAHVCEQLRNDADFVFQQSSSHKSDHSGLYGTPDTVQYCVLASLVFEIGAFGEDCDQLVRDQLLAVAKVFFPKQVTELTAARKQHYNSGIDKIFMDPRVPWYWTFAFYSTLSSEGTMSVVKILKNPDARRLIRTIRTNDVLKNDHYVNRLLSIRFRDAKSTLDLGQEIIENWAFLLSSVRSIQERMDQFMNGCRTENRMYIPGIRGTKVPAFLIDLLKRSLNVTKGSDEELKVCNRYLSGFVNFINSANPRSIPVEDIITIISGASVENIQRFVTASESFAMRALIDALCVCKMAEFHSEVTASLFSRDLVSPFKIERFIHQMLRNGATFSSAVDFISKLTNDRRTYMTNKFKDSFPLIPVLQGLGRKRKFLIPTELILIRIVSNDNVEVPVFMLVPSNTSVLEFHCRAAERFPIDFSFVLVHDGALLMPDDSPVAHLANKKLFIVRNDKTKIDKVRESLNI